MINPQECHSLEEDEFIMHPLKDNPNQKQMKVLYKDMKSLWEIREGDLFNPESLVQYHVYIEGLAKTLSKYVGYDVDLKQNKDIRKLKMTITSQHHQYHKSEVQAKNRRVQKEGDTLHILS